MELILRRHTSGPISALLSLLPPPRPPLVHLLLRVLALLLLLLLLLLPLLLLLSTVTVTPTPILFYSRS